MKTLKKIMIVVFFIALLGAIGIGVKYVLDNVNAESYTFNNSGYAITLGSKNDITAASIYNFDKDTEYNYKKLNDNISFTSEEGSTTVENNTVIHYSDNSLLVLKDVVAIDLTKLDTTILYYYNIFKNTTISNKSGVYTITNVNNEEVTFNSMLMRISEDKYLLTGSDVRLMIDDEIKDLGNFAYIEYTDGDVVQVYNETEYYKIISKGAKVVLNDININIDTGVIYKETKAKLTLSNLIIDYDGNVDVIPEEEKDLTLPEMKDANVDLPVSSISQSTLYEEEKSGEVVEDEEPTAPTFKVTGLGVTPNSLNAKIEIKDEDALITTGTHVSIVENATYTTVYETDSEMGNQEIPISYTGLNPDTEYTLYAESTYKLDDVSYTRNFVSKIFRTESIGIDFEKVFATSYSVDFKVARDDYSNVEELKVGIYTAHGVLVNTKTIKFESSNEVTDTFYDLTSNTTYILKIYDLVIDGVVSEYGYTENLSFKTLKNAPTIGELSYQIDKKEGGFNLNVASVVDSDYGITGYRYEVYDARTLVSESDPLVVVNADNIGTVFVKVDESKLFRGQAYTYVLVVEFNDNEKTIEYSKTYNQTMKLDGVQFPTISWAGDFITWEQINGSIIVSDPSGAIISNKYKIVYYNSINTYKTTEITADTSTGNIPIIIKNLRANETYTFQVYADVNLQDGNPVNDETYIGCVYVKTGNPTPLQSAINETGQVTDSFELQFQLSMNPVYKTQNKYNCVGQDNCDASNAVPYEAATLSELTFELYQGTSTNGIKVATKKELYTPADESKYYSSTISSKVLSPSSITITPEYLGIQDVSDLTARTYTLKVSGLYDYTEYKNEIPLEGTSEYTITLANYAQKKCADQDNAIRVQEIQNKNADSFGLSYNSKLNPTTVVAYRILADYSDSGLGTAKGIRYYLHVYNPTTQKFEQVGNYRSASFDSNGELDYILYEVDYGTKNTYDTDTLRRGNTYYWTFEVDIDSDGDGTIDMVYPKLYDEEWYCGSPQKTPMKQRSTFTTYPSVISGTTARIKYKYIDYDNALTSDTLSAYVNGSNSRTSMDNITKADEFQTVEFTGITEGTYFQIKKNEKLSSQSDATDQIVMAGYNYNQISSVNLSYSVSVTDNYLIVSIDNYEDVESELNKLGAISITITPTSKSVLDEFGSKTYSNDVSFTGGKYKINLLDISDYLGYEVNVTVKGVIDTGISGFEAGGSDMVGIQRYSIDGPSNYYYNKETALFSNSSSRISNTYSAVLDTTNSLLKITPTNGSKTYSIPVTIDSTGVSYGNNNIILKTVVPQTLNSASNKVTFNSIQPGVSITDGSGRRSITPGLQFAQINARIITAGQDIKDTYNNGSGEVACEDCIFMEVFTTDDNGGNASELITSPIAIPLSEFTGTYKLANLAPQTNYYFKLYTYMKNKTTGNYEKTYLHDIDDPDAEQTNGYQYAFKTNSAVEVKNVNLEFKSESYENKQLELTYQVSSITEYDGIEYELLVWNGSKYVASGITIANSETLNYAMTVNIAAPPQVYPNVKWGKKYKVLIKPYGTYNNNGTMEKKYLTSGDGSDGYEFQLDAFRTPSIVISTPQKPETSLYFLISPQDVDHIIVNDTYNITVKDEDDNLIYSENDVSTALPKAITLDKSAYNLVDGKNYTLTVSTKYDFNNDGQESNFMSKTFKKTLRFGNGVTIGNITATQISTGENTFGINLIFTQTFDLTRITKISYSIINDTTSAYALNETKDFIVTANGNIYTYNIEVPEEAVENFDAGSVYTISLNFYEYDEDTLENKLIGQDDVRFVYGG